MSAEENKELVHRFVEEFWNQGKMTVADELMAPGAEIHMPTGEVLDPDELKNFVGTWRESFPDWHSTFEELIAEGDRVAERWTGRGTHLAELHLGELQGIPPTGKRVEAPGSVFYRIVDGRIVEFRGQFDMMGLMQQLGAIASPQQAEA
jgi:predicted ester cyclase